VRKLFVVLFFAAVPAAPAQLVSPPPGDPPTEVRAGVYLLNLNALNEKDETFEADLYLRFVWRDPRLKHEGAASLLFMEEAAEDKLKEIWWPEIEFINASSPEITNQVLEIAPDGTVALAMGLTSTFRADLDLRRFPFDCQTLEVRIQSFVFDAAQLRFVVDDSYLGFRKGSTFEGTRVSGLEAKAVTDDMQGMSKGFSEFVAEIKVERNASFFFWTVFGPVVLIFLISCTVFLVPAQELADRVGICLTALLACIATQFTLSFSLPQISYLTLIDRLFIATYAFVTFNVLVASIQAIRGEPGPRVKGLLALGIPLSYAVVLALLMTV